MKIFINDIPVILTRTEKLPKNTNYDLTINGASQKIDPRILIDDVLIVNASPESVDDLLHVMTDKKLKSVDSITVASEDHSAMKKHIKKKFDIVEAAGGVVSKDGMILLIYRKGKWDLPKGKLDKGEKRRACARREIFEETGVEVEIEGKIGHTWHTYIRNRKYVLKKTHWYAMKCLNDSAMSPQAEEDIEDVQWMNVTQTRSALYDSYRSIRVVIQDYNKMLIAKTPSL